MKFRMYFMGLVLGMVLFGCGETKDAGADSKNVMEEPKIENKNDQTIVNKAGQTIVSHQFGELILRKNLSSNNDYFASSYLDGYKYYERYPNIVHKKKLRGNQWVEILFYDTSRSTILKKIDLEKANPYLNQFENIENGFPTFEIYEGLSGNDNTITKASKPDKYLTYYQSGLAFLNGFSTNSYCLVPIKGNKILDWRTKILIWTKKGKLYKEIDSDNYSSISGISDDGDLVIMRYGNYPENPYDNAPDGEFRILNIKNNKLLLKIIPDTGYSASITGLERKYLHILMHRNRKRDSTILDIIDLKKRERYFYKLSTEEYKSMYYNNVFKDASDLIDILPFTKSKF